MDLPESLRRCRRFFRLIVPLAGAVVVSSLAVACSTTVWAPAPPAFTEPPVEVDEEARREAPSEGALAHPPSPCPSEMVLVAGAHCPKVRQPCLRWVDPPGPYREFRCAEYAPSTCLAPREKKRFCVDREEFTAPGDALPLANQSWTSAGALCESLGKRLCFESEWQLACEGEDMWPYPYGDGLHRDADACNIDQRHLGRPESGLRDLRAPATAHPRCVSPYGVLNMSGNVEEWATLDRGRAPDRSAMKGAWWLPGKNTCRAVTLGHGEIYRGPQVGVRCCRDVP